MIKIEFSQPLTALEIRDPAIEVCTEIAVGHGLYANFHQGQQAAFENSFSRATSKKVRIGNGKHLDWLIDYQLEELRVARPTVVGRIVLRSPIDEKNMQFGGFDYGKYGEPKPMYPYITVHTSNELGYNMPIDPPEPELLQVTYDGLRTRLEELRPRLF